MIEKLNEAIRQLQIGQSYLTEADREATGEDREVLEAVADKIDELIGKLEELQF